ncbi:hypothetical protein K437DRAFT_286057 [Tilletiaria anomala UBC 951]|uniref:ABC transporter domain-containing protein n=1 Tax=Tilletiaria anomala (strain ATCC 24038 / CBS 436.72 / UBC 951) TaxID=1037660 RepID=A0A066VSJ3_TILAU|nr:uncharacterized protein K437DRAFT_286057 [Tilletiaria anomala UBC 951]KDN44707.1 hypothetical protein K437DRAFT_286057 [Tilletiaria anomala UBC 951]
MSSTSHAPGRGEDIEAQPEDRKDEKAEVFDLRNFILTRQAQAESEGKNTHHKPVGVAWRNLDVYAPPGTRGGVFVKTLPVAIGNTAWRDPLNILYFLISGLSKLRKSKPFGESAPTPILQGHMGILRPSEMLLVLGRPGSGCSTTLRALTSNLASNLSRTGSLTYGGFDQEEVARKMRGEVIFIDEEDTHFPTLTVAQTLRFALRTKVPHKKSRVDGESRSVFIETLIDVLLKMFAMSHVRDTIVGGAAVRGISGGERKRVTISEGLATRAAVIASDNSTRGLDASTALEYARSLKIITDLSKRTSIATLYQVSESIYNLFDRVCVIDKGRCIYYGPREQARRYFEELGYFAGARQTTADFVTAVTDPLQMEFREGFENSAPRTAAQREQAWKNSELYSKLEKEYEEYMQQVRDSESEEAEQLKAIVRDEKNQGVRKGSSYTVSFWEQIKATIVRQIQIKLAAREELQTKIITVIGVSLMISSLFYNQPFDSSGTFMRGGILLFSTLFVGWLQLSEAFEAVSGRPILFRHKQFAFAHPSAIVISRALVDIPLLVLFATLTSVITYFLAHLRVSAGGFWLYFIFVFLSAYSFTALYRLFAALSPSFNEAIRFSALALNVSIVFSGYVLPRNMMNWTVFLSWINATSYAFEGFMANEFRYPIECSPAHIVPFNEVRNPAYQTCALAGATAGSLTVDPEAYLQTSYGYSTGHIGRSLGAVIGFTFLYLILTVIFSEIFDFQGAGGVNVFARTKRTKRQLRSSNRPMDIKVEKVASNTSPTSPNPAETIKPSLSRLVRYESKPIFTWRNVNLELDSGRKLLQNVDGLVRPGRMTALMGASGAGKTTLMCALSQRAVAGKFNGEVLVDGKPLGPGFQKSTGFVLQGDIHVGTQTVREAIEFAALLRQSAEVSREQKLKDAQAAIELLELTDLQDAVIGMPGAGLNVERRKRVSIAVELASKPDLLLFLDEPTSGLDSAGAASIGRLLRRLAEDGQAILCTIHQPSSELFESFDDVILLQNEGRLTYAGPIGDSTVINSHRNSNVVREYFESHGGEYCPPDANVAEYLLETVSSVRGDGMQWNERWLVSEECKQLREWIDNENQQRRSRPVVEDSRATREFSASAWVQLTEVTKRQFRDLWRDSSYAYGVLFSNFVVGFVAGGAFAHVGNSSRDLQNRAFVVFLVILNFPAVINAIIAKFFELRIIFEARESPSKTFAWWALVAAFIITSLPIAVIASIIYFLTSFFLPFYSQSTSTAGYFYLMTLLINIFEIVFSIMLAASSPTPVTASNLLPFILPILAIVNGVMVPQTQLPQPWKSVYWTNPIAYYIRGQVANILAGVPVVCDEPDTYRFDPPPGQSCGAYAGEWAQAAGGYIEDVNATAGCGYCPYRSGDMFLSSLNAVRPACMPFCRLRLGD